MSDSAIIGALLVRMDLTADERAWLSRLLCRAPSGSDTYNDDDGTGPTRASPDTEVSDEEPGRYEDLRDGEAGVLGIGGMGQVVVVRDRHLRREVAWKELRWAGATRASGPGSGAPPSSVDRFLREARVTARLEHPHIVPVHELGRRPDGSLYYTMRRVRGRSLASAIDGASTLPERLGLIAHYANLCNAIAFAHSRGVLHRDIKPANVMVGEFGETVVLDWGLAGLRSEPDVKRDPRSGMETLQQDSGQTVAGAVMGTPSYMSPEQAGGRPMDERSDVWSLGAVLYEILSGHPPYREEDARTTLARALIGDVPPLRGVVPGAPPDLVAVAEKALHANPVQRYQSVRELIADVDAWRDGRRVGVYEYGRRELLARFVARYRLPIAVASVGAVLLIAVATVGFLNVRKERDRAVASETQTRSALNVARVRGLRASAREAELRGDAGSALALWRVLLSIGEAVGPEIHRLYTSGAASRVFAVGTGRISQVLWADGGRTIVTLDDLGVVGFWDAQTGVHRKEIPAGDAPARAIRMPPGDDKVVVIRERLAGGARVETWDIPTGGRISTWDEVPVGKFFREELSPDGRTIALAHQTLRVHDTETGMLAFRMESDPRLAQVNAVAWVGDQLAVAVMLEPGVRLLDPQTGLRRGFLATKGNVYRLAKSSDGARLSAADQGGELTVWDVQTGKALAKASAGPSAIYGRGLALGPDGARLAMQDKTGLGVLLQGSDGAVVRPLESISDTASLFRFSPGGALLAGATGDNRVRLWAAPDGETVGRLGGATGPISDLAFSPDERELAWGSADGRVRIQRLGPDAALQAPKHYPGTDDLVSIAVEASGERLAAGSISGNAMIWRDGQPTQSLHLDGLIACRVAFAGSGPQVVVLGLGACQLGTSTHFASGDMSLISGDTFDGAEIWTMGDASPKQLWADRRPTREGGGGAALSADGGAFAYAPDEGGVRMGRVGADGVVALSDSSGGTSLTFLDDGRALAGLFDETSPPLRTWGADAGLLGAFGPDQTGPPVAAPRGAVVYSVAEGTGTIDRWDVHARAALPPLAGIDAGGGILAVASDDSILVQGNDAGALRVTASDGTILSEARTGDGPIKALVLSSDGKRYARASGTVVAVHDAATGSTLQTFELDRNNARILTFDPLAGHLYAALSDGSVTRWDTPPLDPVSTSRKAGADTNLRVCPDSYEVVPVVPSPPAETVWAPQEACRASDVQER